MIPRLKLFAVISLLLTAVIITGCGKQQGDQTSSDIGTAANPIKMAMVPSLDTQKLVVSGEKLAQLMEKETGLKYQVSVPTSYTAVITAMGAGTVDIGWLSPIPYIIAHDRYGVKVMLKTVRKGSTDYYSFIIARNDSGLKKLADLKGKTFAYGDPVSTSGTIYPKHLIRTSGYNPDTFFSNAIYAGAHDRVVIAVYNKQVDAGAIYGQPGDDARKRVMTALPDVLKKTSVIAQSIPIPNDTVSLRKGLPPAIARKIVDGLIAVSKSAEGRKLLYEVGSIDGFAPATDKDYDSVRSVARAENIQLEQIDKKK
jgi:phosphonate transport system substrate-binding protein